MREEEGDGALHCHLPSPFSRWRRRGRGGGELSGLLGDQRVCGGAWALHARRGGGGLACQRGRTLTGHPGSIHYPDAHTGDRHTHGVTYDDEERGERGCKGRSGEKGVPLYLPNAALVRGKKGKRDMRSEVMQ